MNKPWSVSPERCGGIFDACYQLEAVSLKRLLPVRLRDSDILDKATVWRQ